VRLSLLLFDDSGYPGCGPNYAPVQSIFNVLNIPCREVPLRTRVATTGRLNIPECPSYLDWQTEHKVINEHRHDEYPSRASIGKYLQARFRSWMVGWESTDSVELVSSSVLDVELPPMHVS